VIRLVNRKPSQGMTLFPAPAALTRLPVALSADVRERLVVYAARKRISLSTAAAMLIERGLRK
jgi:hypothetical protein